MDRAHAPSCRREFPFRKKSRARRLNEGGWFVKMLIAQLCPTDWCRGLAEKLGDPVGMLAHRAPDLVDSPSGQVALDPRYADDALTGAGMTKECGSHAEDSFGILFIVNGKTPPTRQGEIVEESVNVRDGVCGTRDQARLCADCTDLMLFECG